MITGENSIIKMSEKARNETEITTEKEKIILACTEANMLRNGIEMNSDKLLYALNSNNIYTKNVYGNDKIGFCIILENKRIYELEKNGTIEFKGINIETPNNIPIMISGDGLRSLIQKKYKEKIVKIEIKPYITKLENIVDKVDVSKNKDKSVISYIILNENKEYELYIMGNGMIQISDATRLFEDFSSVKEIKLQGLDTTNTISMQSMFYNCNNLIDLNLANINTNEVTTMQLMFYKCSNLKSLDLSNFDTSKVENMSSMFDSCKSLENIKLNSFDTTQVDDMSAMFINCSNLKNLNLSNFNMEHVKKCFSMFAHCVKLENITIDKNKFRTSRVTRMERMFWNCYMIKEINLNGFYTKNVTSMLDVFNGCKNLRSLDISNFDISYVQSMKCMFYNCSNLVDLDLNNFNPDSASDMENMFGANALNNFNEDALNQVMYMCSKAQVLDKNNKNLKYLGITYEKALQLQKLENYIFLKNSGWRTGY